MDPCPLQGDAAALCRTVGPRAKRADCDGEKRELLHQPQAVRRNDLDPQKGMCKFMALYNACCFVKSWRCTMPAILAVSKGVSTAGGIKSSHGTDFDASETAGAVVVVRFTRASDTMLRMDIL